jgi:hypothetical protein
MPNSSTPPISIHPGAPVAFLVVVTANSVDPNTGVNTGAVDTTTPLTFEYVQGGPGDPTTAAVTASVDPGNNRRVICTAANIQPGQSDRPWSLRVKANGRTSWTVASGTSSAAPDVSGVAWDGSPPGPA